MWITEFSKIVNVIILLAFLGIIFYWKHSESYYDNVIARSSFLKQANILYWMYHWWDASNTGKLQNEYSYVHIWKLIHPVFTALLFLVIAMVDKIKLSLSALKLNNTLFLLTDL